MINLLSLVQYFVSNTDSMTVTKFGEMKNRILLLSIFLVFSCEEEKVDTVPLEIIIVSHSNNETVYEIVTITCTATDDEGVAQVELWVPGDTTGIVDEKEPYDFQWNTNDLEDGSYTLKIRAVDINNNADSTSLTLLVDNSLAIPAEVNIKSISYTLNAMTILFYRSTDEDFNYYELFSSASDSGQKTLMEQISDIDDTLLTITDFDPTIPTWYWLKVTDIYGYSVFGDSYYIMDDNPTAIELNSPIYRNGYFDFSWTINNNDDFSAYVLYESTSENMLGKSEIARISDQDDTNHSIIVDIIAPIKYYQVIVEDQWGFQSGSNIQLGKMPFTFIKTFGGSQSDRGYSVQQTLDGGFIIAGSTSSYGAGGSDVWLLKTDAQGNYSWAKTFGGVENDKGNAVYQTSDGGYIVTGYTKSYGNGNMDVWLIKTDGNGTSCGNYSEDGNCYESSTKWTSAFGTSGNDYGNAVHEVADGGYILTGKSGRFPSILLIKTDTDGNQEWENIYGGSGSDWGFYLEQIQDSGILFVGKEVSNGNTDLSLIKVDLDGNVEWHSVFGGTEADAGYHFNSTSDGGFILTGSTQSYGNGQWDDLWLIKSSVGGSMEWQTTYGNNYSEQGHYVKQNANGGYMISGFTESIGQGLYDIWLIGTDNLGNEVFSQTFGGQFDDKSFAADQTDDGGLIIVGYTESFGNGNGDILLIKIDPEYEP